MNANQTIRSRPAGTASAIVTILLAASVSKAQAADLTDIWQDRRQPGTHFSVAQQNDRIHLTISTFDQNGNPLWYVAPDAKVYAYVGKEPQFRGTLYRTKKEQIGINFGEPQLKPVGEVFISTRSATRLDIDATAEGERIKSVVTRVTWRQDDFGEGYAVSYYGRRVAESSQAGDSEGSAEGNRRTVSASRYLGNATYEVADGMARLSVQRDNKRCHYIGYHVPSGRIASIVGNFRCTDGESGMFEMTEFSATANGFSTFLKTTSADYRVTDSGSLGGGRTGLFIERIPEEEPVVAAPAPQDK